MSWFQHSRTHPVFGYDAAHRGIDYSASTGTKVRTVAGGTVEFAGWQRLRQHRRGAPRREALDPVCASAGFQAGGVKGARVAQGDVVGFVGTTGWSTGPHLHFEVKIKGNPVNPLTAELPGSEPLAESQRDALAAVAAPLRDQLALLERIRVAAAVR
jgi:hypothetical protein